MSRNRRRRVDWEEERRRTERSQMKGLRYSALSFLMAFFFLLMTKTFYRDYPLKTPLIVLGALLFGTFAMLFVQFRKSKRKRDE